MLSILNSDGRAEELPESVNPPGGGRLVSTGRTLHWMESSKYSEFLHTCNRSETIALNDTNLYVDDNITVPYSA